MTKLPLDELSTVIARIMGLLLTENKVDRAVHHLAQAIKESVPGTLGAGVTILDAGGRRTSAGFTDPTVEHADHLQYDLGQGPCLSAWAGEEAVLVEDVSTDLRWPEWSVAVSSLPIRSVISVPLLAGGSAVGALKVYAASPGVYGPEEVALLELFASPAATLLAHIQTSGTVERISRELQAALDSRDVVNQARGILIERHGLTPDRALHHLMRMARDSKSTLQAVSVDLVAGTTANPS